MSLAGRTLSHFQVIEEISRGGMGVVYRATDTRLGRDVALKVLPSDLMADQGRRQRFLQEARAAATLEHPNVAVIHDIGEVDGVTFIAMELVRGDKLSAAIVNGPLPPARALELGIEIAEGLARAHDKGIIHRDLKPSNVMLTEDGHAKVIDFGLAKLIAPLDGDTGGETFAMGAGTDPGLVMGTVSYMSPEQAAGSGVDHRSDIFSFGILIYELLTARPPFRANTSIDTLHAILNLPAPPLPSLKPAEVTAEIQRIIDKCLVKEPGGRYQGMRDLAVDLRAARRRLETSGMKTRSPVAALSSRQTRTMVALAGAIVLATAAGLVLWQRSPSPPAISASDTRPSVAVLYFENNTGNPQLDWLRTGLTDMMVTDLSQSPDLDVLGTDRLVQILTEMKRQDDRVMSADVMQEIARRAGVKTVLVGSYVKAGDTIRINMKMQEASTGRIITSERVEADGEANIFPTMDDLTRRIKAKFTMPGAGIAAGLLKSPTAAPGSAANAIEDTFDRDLREVTTSSIEAYRYYAEGINLHERFREEQALPLLEKAVSIDPGFALAYTKLAVVHANLGHSNRRDEYSRKALEHLDRLTPRERYYIQAYNYSARPETADKAIENYTKALELSPNHTSSRNNLGLILAQVGNNDEAIRHYTILQDRGFEFPGAAYALAILHVLTGQPERGVAVAQRYTTRFPDSEAGVANLGTILGATGHTAEAYAAFDRAIALRPGLPVALIGRTALAMLADRWGDVEEAGRQEARGSDSAIQWRGNVVLATRELYRGRSREALAFLSAAVATQGRTGSSESALARAQMGWILLAKHQPADAYSEARRALVDAQGRGPIFENYSLAAIAAAQAGRTSESNTALTSLTQAANALPGDRQKVRIHETSGVIALGAQDTATAVRELSQAEAMLPPGGVAVLIPVVQEGPPIWYALGLAHLAAGQDAEARKRFEKIVGSEYQRLYRPIEYVRSFYYLGQIAERQGDMVKARQSFARFAKYWKDGDLDRPQVEEALRKSQGA